MPANSLKINILIHSHGGSHRFESYSAHHFFNYSRIWDYRFGQNIDYTPKAFEGYCYEVLRDLADGTTQRCSTLK